MDIRPQNLAESAKRRIFNLSTRCFPSLIWKTYAHKSSVIGIDKLYLILSFDCDTPEDAEAAIKVNDTLNQYGIKVTYAVPGQQLMENLSIYRQLADMGGDFINHGTLPHAEWRNNQYYSTTFYHLMSSTEIIEDIQRGHEIVTKISGCEPVGFRAPHFGLFQNKDQLALQYNILQSLGYKYSTSTLPQFALRHGPIFNVGGLYEIPLSGSYKSFFNILDSWNNIISPQNPVLKENYANLFIQTVDALCKMNLSGLLNYYVDPSHICHNDFFYRAILHAHDCGVETLHYSELIALVERSHHKTSLKVLSEA